MIFLKISASDLLQNDTPKIHGSEKKPISKDFTRPYLSRIGFQESDSGFKYFIT